MGTVTDPYTFTNGTVANALEVNSRYNTLYTLVNGNIDSANMTLSASFAWTGAHSFSATTTFTGDIYQSATKKHYWDGGSNTYTYESSGDEVTTVAGGTSAFTVSGSGATPFFGSGNSDCIIGATKKLRVDGSSSGNTHISESSADEMQHTAGGTNVFFVSYNSGSPYFGSGNADCIVGATKYFRYDGSSSGNTHDRESSADTVQHTRGGTVAFTSTASGILPVTADPPTANYVTRDSSIKAWVYCDSAATIQDGYNVSSVTTPGTGRYAVTWNTDFAADDYPVTSNSVNSSGYFTYVFSRTSTPPAGLAVEIRVKDDAGSLQNSAICVIAAGVQ